LVLECIPVIQKNYLVDLLSDLPVMFVGSWCEVTEKNLARFKQSMKARQFNYDKLLLSYWAASFRRATQ